MVLSRLAARLQAPRPAATAVETGDDVREIRAPLRIAALLQRTFERHSLLTVAVSGSEDVFTSALLEVVADGRYVVLDELSPAAGHALISVGRRIHVSSRLEGVQLGFESIIRHVNSAGGIAYYQVPFPDALFHHQRREHYRAPVPLERGISVQLRTAGGRVITGELRDISRGGLSMRVDPGAPERLTAGDVVPRCVVRLADKRTVNAVLQVCYADQWGSTGRPRVGGRFLEIEPGSERVVDALVATLDRELARRAQRY
ncbi:MAG: flagellar brake protein [Gammaproteobacteria bacterium]|nr:flagellar brake protein [Gammaproteobacteria bacterium]